MVIQSDSIFCDVMVFHSVDWFFRVNEFVFNHRLILNSESICLNVLFYNKTTASIFMFLMFLVSPI